ncbi:MAG: menaquinone biosynthesis protein [Syntrophomonas sp.]|uniref:menaquinone biosynthetic enzyme MqnA/MqnD family protein n=1 Tax=Syntrophomonas sp. TaxID=2053627 RepID=UPI00260CF48B|nr:menaquinone biosynthesis protein [Syntrophomonas sp.]MDD2509776.1 menaquinone biosynthesis protein [Syntrophomonas sp.]MDD3879910.1 menaquinone biosynthesis protein [Syntrophomonas sp.]MDD4625731.1 menaquinone biosynthesis protein [Syntrophomonas sp.]
MRPRVGHIQFINCFPLFYGLIEKKFLLEIDLIKGNPSDLNRMLQENLLDLAPIPSIAYARNYQDYVLMPDISISCDGEVKSIYFFSKVPINELHHKKVALTNTSATSQALLRVILARYYNIQPEYFSSAPELGAMLLEADAALLIGDDALRARYKNQDRLYIYDLGEEWKKFTGLPMVFALWAIRKDFAGKNREQLKIIKQTFTESIKFSLENVRDVAEKASQWEDFGADYLVDYFRCLRFDFDFSKQEGLLEYYRQAKNQGLLDEVPPLEILDI